MVYVNTCGSVDRQMCTNTDLCDRMCGALFTYWLVGHDNERIAEKIASQIKNREIDLPTLYNLSPVVTQPEEMPVTTTPAPPPIPEVTKVGWLYKVKGGRCRNSRIAAPKICCCKVPVCGGKTQI